MMFALSAITKDARITHYPKSSLKWALFASQLFVKFGHVVVPLCLIARPCNRSAEAVLLPETLYLEFPTVVPRAIGEYWFGTVNAARLLINQPHVSMETWRRAFARVNHHRCPGWCYYAKQVNLLLPVPLGGPEPT